MDGSRSRSSSVDEYIVSFPPPVREILQELRAAIKTAAPDAEEKISYQMPTYYLQENLVHFAAYENHIGFYPTPEGIIAFRDELSAYKASKGAVRFPIEKPLPLELISRIVKFRVAQSNKKSKK